MNASFRYRRAALAADYARGAGGFALTAGPLWLAGPASGPAWVLGAAAALFLLYFARTVVRHLTQIELDETGIRARGPLGGAIRWQDLRSIRLGYYATRSDRAGGWMQLEVRGARGSIRADSGLERFADLAAAVAGEAHRRGRALDERTRENLGALGAAPAGDG
jgi:hypothetical protein